MFDSEAKVGRVIAEPPGDSSQQFVADALPQLGWRSPQATVPVPGTTPAEEHLHVLVSP
ncbi:hypothetical protein [Arthrobacter sp.]|uniref:hypothetical protein n=1 Tax=Arthrobacter sp. TaxID=1667 RepID=UPI0028124449|nr:hypothetical protein [Arthrobacter sp.]